MRKLIKAFQISIDVLKVVLHIIEYLSWQKLTLKLHIRIKLKFKGKVIYHECKNSMTIWSLAHELTSYILMFNLNDLNYENVQKNLLGSS